MMQNHSADSPCLEDFFTQIPIAILSKNAKLCQKVASQSANHFGIAQRTWGSRGSVSCPPCKHRSCHKRSLVASMRVACQTSVIRLSLGGSQPSADPTFDISNNFARRATEVGLVNEPQKKASPKSTTNVHRRASKQINFRVSEPDYLKLAQSAQTLNLSVPAFVKKKAQGARIIAPKLGAKEAQELTRQLAKIGGNLNQLTKHANQGGNVPAQALQELQSEVAKIWQQLT